LPAFSVECTGLRSVRYPAAADASTPESAVPGLHPPDLRAAYEMPPTGGNGKTVAVIAAGDDPTVEADLAVYRKAFGLPVCPATHGCFRKVNQYGGRVPLSGPIPGWTQEMGLDVQMISAVCPACRILLVEARTADLGDLAGAVDTAVALGADVVSNSYYAPEYDSELDDEAHFNHPGVAITASSGDLGYGPTFPAASRYVTAVGGTTLVRDTHGAWTEYVWPVTGSGCSKYVAKPTWQHDVGCMNRTVTDLAIVADPQTGVAAFNTTAPASERGWGVYGGTSIGAPIVAALYALAGGKRVAHHGAAHAYARPAAFRGVSGGSNGVCTPVYLCTAGPGYNGPAGLGSPIGLGGF
jgi:subtilase family serine protease